MQLAEPARREARGTCPGGGAGCSARSNGRLGLERGVERLDHALRAAETALGDRAARAALVGQLAAARQVDAGDLEKRDALVAVVDVPARRLDEALQQASSAASPGRPRSARGASRRSGSLAVGTSERRVRLGEAEPDEQRPRRAAAAAAPASARPNISRRGRERERNVVEPEARDLLDEVDLAGDVARAPRRHESRRSSATSNPSRSRSARCSLGRRLEPDQRVGALRPEPHDRALGQVAVHVGVGRASGAPASSRSSCVASVGRLRRQVRVDALLPAVRALGAQPEPLGGAGGSRPARSWRPRAGRRSSRRATSVSSPPMIPASATARSRVGDHEVGRLELAVRRRRACAASRRRRARRTTIRPPASVVQSNAWSGLPSASIT